MYQDAEKLQVRRRQAEKAIQLAMANRWEEAVTVNRAIISLFPNDADSYNRLGKALMELNRYKAAKEAYDKALKLDPSNQIARKNLARLGTLTKAKVPQAETTQVAPTLFIEEMGKSALTTLHGTTAETLASLNAGDRLELRTKGATLAVETPKGQLVGLVEPKLGRRLAKLLAGGNQYTAAVTNLSDNECRIIIKETYRDPSQAGRPSFPSAIIGEGTRPYIKESLLRYEGEVEELEAADETEELAGEAREAWEDERVHQEGDVRLYEAAAAEDAADEELEE